MYVFMHLMASDCNECEAGLSNVQLSVSQNNAVQHCTVPFMILLSKTVCSQWNIADQLVQQENRP